MGDLLNLNYNVETGKTVVIKGESINYEIDGNLVDVVDEDGTSVLVRVGNEDLKVWVDTKLVGGEVETNWNKQIFFLKNGNDLLIKGIQESPELSRRIMEAALYYAEDYIYNVD